METYNWMILNSAGKIAESGKITLAHRPLVDDIVVSKGQRFVVEQVVHYGGEKKLTLVLRKSFSWLLQA